MTTAFVLAGGGSLGAVEVGMLEALAEAGVTPDFVVGSSVGAINGAWYCGAPTLEGVRELRAIWSGLRRADVFPVRPFGALLSLLSVRDHLFDARPLRRLIASHLPYARIEDAVLPLHVVATDLRSGAEVVLSQGRVVDAVLASAAIPAVFPAVRLGGRLLVDGGVANNAPVSAAIALGARRVIVLPTGFACALQEPPRGALGMALHALSLLIAGQLLRDVERHAREARIRVVPPLCPLEGSPVDFSRAAALMQRALRSTRAWLAQGGLDAQSPGRAPGALSAHSHRA